jgi:hypothetical protein
MIANIIVVSLFSLVFIALIHHLILFLMNTLTVPKVKDLIKTPQEKYDKIYSIIQNVPPLGQQDTTPLDLSPDSDMKTELMNFLKQQMNP